MSSNHADVFGDAVAEMGIEPDRLEPAEITDVLQWGRGQTRQGLVYTLSDGTWVTVTVEQVGKKPSEASR
jgi:hypothetical protein